MEIRPEIVFERALTGRPRVSLILLDWCCRESFHILEYLARQDVPREWFEVLWIEYYDRRAPDIAHRIELAEAGNETPPVDRWIVMNMPRTAYYHKHLMYNVGILASRGELVMIGDSDAIVTPAFVRTLCETFEKSSDIVLHLDEVRSHSRRFYPFNYPSIEEVLAEDCVNWKDGTTTGLLEKYDPLHSLNYGACVCARRDDVLAIGGADEHLDYLGHICGPYDLTWRLVNSGHREVWHPDEFLYHVWHPGSDGDDNYTGPHDGRNVSTLALQARRTRRVLPMVENAVIRQIRETGQIPDRPLEDVIKDAIGDRPVTDWVIDDTKRAISNGRSAWSQRRYEQAIAVWEPIRGRLAPDARFLGDLGWSYYFAGRHADARAAFEEVLGLEGDNSDAHRGLGWTLGMLGQHAAALGAYAAAIAHADPADKMPLQEAHRGRAWSHFHLGDFQAATADFEAAMLLTPAHEANAVQDLCRGLGWVELRLGRPRAAALHFEHALAALAGRRGPESDDALAGLAASRRESGDVRAPEPPARDAGVRNPSERDDPGVRATVASRLRTDLGWAYYAVRQYAAAAAAFEEALAFDPNNSQAECGFGWASLQCAEPDRAHRAFDHVLREHADAAGSLARDAYRGRGWSAHAEGRYEEAIADFTRALRLVDATCEGSAVRDIHRGRGRAYYLAGLKQPAVEDFARAGDRWAVPAILGLRGRAIATHAARLLFTVRQRGR